MSIGRQKYQPIALADILVIDDDQSTAESVSDVPNLDRMHIHIDMPDSPYWGAHRRDSLPSTCSGGPQSTAAYQDVTPFSSVSWTRNTLSFCLQIDRLLVTMTAKGIIVTDQHLGVFFQFPSDSRHQSSNAGL